MNKNIHLWFGSSNIQSSENRIAIPKQGFKLDIVERGLPVYWFVEKESNRVAISKKIVANGGDSVDKLSRKLNMKQVDHTTVGKNRVVTIPKQFFKDFEGKAKGSRPLSQNVRFERQKECHFLTSRKLWKKQACYIIQNENKIYEIIEGDNKITDGGINNGPLSMPNISDDEALILETGEIIKIDSARSLLEESNTSEIDDERPVILIVEDEPDVAETYRIWLEDHYEVMIAGDGDEGLDLFDESVDVVLLDRMMPGLSGDELLERIRERGFTCQVAMVTAVDPDFDILEMGFNAYLKKPIGREQLRKTVKNLLERSEYNSLLQEYYSLVEKKALLESEKSPDELAESSEYNQLLNRIEELKNEHTEVLEMTESDIRFLDRGSE